MQTLIIDNYDSFTYNLYQYVGELKGNPVVYLNDKIGLSKINQLRPSHIIISPGPGSVENPKDFGVCEEVIKKYSSKIPILGVCLGHQGIIKNFGGKIEQSKNIFHGKKSFIEHKGIGILKGIENPFEAMRYHSLIGSREHFPAELEITAWIQNENTIMALQHKTLPIFGIQFHPESIGTAAGKNILKNFLEYTKIQ